MKQMKHEKYKSSLSMQNVLLNFLSVNKIHNERSATANFLEESFFSF